jgi:hypothetical protein
MGRARAVSRGVEGRGLAYRPKGCGGGAGAQSGRMRRTPRASPFRPRVPVSRSVWSARHSRALAWRTAADLLDMKADLGFGRHRWRVEQRAFRGHPKKTHSCLPRRKPMPRRQRIGGRGWNRCSVDGALWKRAGFEFSAQGSPGCSPTRDVDALASRQRRDLTAAGEAP